ncbi:TonB-dependent receptor [Lentisalinibacter sediminis]|uniref:TonB-dependent receptor n=1 Tax=Lentisalinibacter sediminis TaxID=2992237 RepID=UPI00386492C9
MKHGITGIARWATAVFALAAMTGAATLAQAQSTRDAFVEEIVVTATKRAGGQEVQDVPVAVTALGEEQIDALYLRDLKALGYGVPNVQLEDIGTTRGVANFSIRGIGISSSIPSIDPTVGVFVDGMYYGIPAGVVFDTFDLASVEVLRGPQGILFGRNVTGGAVLLQTTRPTEEPSMKVKAAVETGNNVITSGVFSGPLNDSKTLLGKFAVYHNKDGGWHTNDFDGSDFGEADTTIIRTGLTWRPAEAVEFLLRTENARSDGDGPAGQNGGLFSRDSFDFAIDFPGSYDNEWDQAILETSVDVGFGNGEIVNILAWREYENASTGDIDATPNFLFHSEALTQQDQLSNELRYSGSFGTTFVTSGVYYLTQDLDYREVRNFGPAVQATGAPPRIVGGGLQEQTTWGVFTQLDYQLSERWTLTLGGRYSAEEKEVDIATLGLGLAQGSPACTIADGCTFYNFVDDEDWSSFTPKVGFQFRPDDTMQIYGFYTRGFRSGGYNMRNTDPDFPPGPLDQETQDSFELGVKADLLGGMMRVNAAVFYNTIEDLQREINEQAPTGVVQTFDNTADATIQGFDLEAWMFATDTITVSVNAGYVDGEYDEIRADLTGPFGPPSSNGVVDEADFALDIPRLAPWSYGARVIYDRDIGNGMAVNAQVSFNHRDQAPYNDNNQGQLKEADMLDASVSLFMMDRALKLSAFGKNLKDEATIGGDTQLGFFPGATFSPLNKGRIIGFEIEYNY